MELYIFIKHPELDKPIFWMIDSEVPFRLGEKIRFGDEFYTKLSDITGTVTSVTHRMGIDITSYIEYEALVDDITVVDFEKLRANFDIIIKENEILHPVDRDNIDMNDLYPDRRMATPTHTHNKYKNKKTKK